MAVVFDGACVRPLTYSGIGIEDQGIDRFRQLRRRSVLLDDCDGLLEPVLRDQRVVRQPIRSRDHFEIYVTGEKLMELFVIPEKLPNRYPVLASADAVTEKKSDVPK